MLDMKKQDRQKQLKNTVDYIYEWFIDDLKKQELKLKKESKPPKFCQHVMVSKSVLDKFYERFGIEILHVFNSVEYVYDVKHEFYGFKCWKVFLERRD